MARPLNEPKLDTELRIVMDREKKRKLKRAAILATRRSGNTEKVSMAKLARQGIDLVLEKMATEEAGAGQ